MKIASGLVLGVTMSGKFKNFMRMAHEERGRRTKRRRELSERPQPHKLAMRKANGSEAEGDYSKLQVGRYSMAGEMGYRAIRAQREISRPPAMLYLPTCTSDYNSLRNLFKLF